VDSHHRQLGRGFNWLGGATVVAKIIDFSTTLALLHFLTRQQVGVASLVISIGMVVEGFNGLGTSEALLQTRSVSRLQLDTLFWYVVAAATLAAALTTLAGPVIQAIYGYAGLAPYFLAVAIKQPLVGMALIPLAFMNRDLQYQRIAIVNVCATIGAAVTRLALGVSGAGAWAMVAGYAASGLFILLGACIARPFRPGLQFRFDSIQPLVRFGFRSAAANVGEQMFKNVDYLLVGWFYGPTQLAIYRVAFDVAMEPAMAVGTLVSRTALPVFARISALKRQMAETLTWALHRLAVLVAPLMVGLMLAAGPLTSLLHDKQGNSYAAAAAPLRLLAAAALLRIATQLLSSMMVGSGRPGTAARLSAATLSMLAAGIVAVGVTLPAHSGIVAVAAIWLGIYPLVMIWSMHYLRRRWEMSFGELARTFSVPLAAVSILALCVAVIDRLIGNAGPVPRVAVVVIATALTYAVLFRYARMRTAVAA
jgi:O-antigen/teichoic acid export membrane protein